MIFLEDSRGNRAEHELKSYVGGKSNYSGSRSQKQMRRYCVISVGEGRGTEKRGLHWVKDSFLKREYRK